MGIDIRDLLYQALCAINEGQKKLYLEMNIQNFENYGADEDPFVDNWKAKGGMTKSQPIELAEIPQHPETGVLAMIVRRGVFNALARLMQDLHNSQYDCYLPTDLRVSLQPANYEVMAE